MNIKKVLAGSAASAIMFVNVAFPAFADHFTFPSTNDANRGLGWAHVDVVDDSTAGEITLEFVSTRAFASCFEYRTDGDTSQATSETNFNPNAHDLYPYICVNNNTVEKTFEAENFVEVRMVFGAEGDERFDWTRFDLPYPRTAEITSPTEGQNVFGSVDFTAFLSDDDADSIQWAVRQGTCAAGTNTVFGNVDGRSDVATINQSDVENQTFSFTGDMTGMTPGGYCFIYNPVEDSGESNIRETVEFNLLSVPVNGNQCKKGGWQSYTDNEGNSFKNQGDCVSYVATGGKNLGAGN